MEQKTEEELETEDQKDFSREETNRLLIVSLLISQPLGHYLREASFKEAFSQLKRESPETFSLDLADIEETFEWLRINGTISKHSDSKGYCLNRHHRELLNEYLLDHHYSGPADYWIVRFRELITNGF